MTGVLNSFLDALDFSSLDAFPHDPLLPPASPAALFPCGPLYSPLRAASPVDWLADLSPLLRASSRAVAHPTGSSTTAAAAPPPPLTCTNTDAELTKSVRSVQSPGSEASSASLTAAAPWARREAEEEEEEEEEEAAVVPSKAVPQGVACRAAAGARLAPAPGDAGGAGGAVRSVIDKAAERRRRNRESSSRCYYNRKKIIGRLGEQISAEKTRLTQLYDRALELRGENARLKKEVVIGGIALPTTRSVGSYESAVQLQTYAQLLKQGWYSKQC